MALECVRALATPTAFRATIGTDDHVVSTWLPDLPADVERDLRHAQSAIFDELAYVDAGHTDMVSNYLDEIEEPLRVIAERGFLLVGIVTSGVRVTPDGERMASSRCVYVLAVNPCLYRVANADRRAVVHRLGVECEGAAALTSDTHGAIKAWTPAEALVDFEGAIPWCPTCALAANACPPDE
jgi:hypothetical protein